jgi:hypothetical protein
MMEQQAPQWAAEDAWKTERDRYAAAEGEGRVRQILEAVNSGGKLGHSSDDAVGNYSSAIRVE